MRIIVILAIIIMNLGLVTNANAQDVCNCRGYDGPGGACYSGPGGPCYSGPGGTGINCPRVCK